MELVNPLLRNLRSLSRTHDKGLAASSGTSLDRCREALAEGRSGHGADAGVPLRRRREGKGPCKMLQERSEGHIDKMLGTGRAYGEGGGGSRRSVIERSVRLTAL